MMNSNKEVGFDKERTTKIYESCIKIFQEHKPTISEIIIAYANIGFALGASIEGVKNKESPPSIEELNKLYYSSPTIGVAMMLQATEVATWYEDWIQVLTKDNLGGNQDNESKNK